MTEHAEPSRRGPSGIRPLALAVAGLALLAPIVVAAPGDPDASFAGDGITSVDWGGSDTGSDVLIQPDGKIVVVGTGFGAPVDLGISRLDSGGILDTGFDGDGKKAFALGDVENGNAVALQPDGKIVAAGATSVEQRAVIVRVGSDGTPDNGFGVAGVRTLEYGGDDSSQDVVIQPDGKILVAGSGGAGVNMAVTRLTADTGTPDTTFNGAGTAPVEFGGNDYAFAMALQADGKVVIAGYTSAGTSHLAVARLNANGTPDSSFDGDGRLTLGASFGDLASAVAVQPDGKIVIVASGGGDARVTRLNPNGSPDTGFDGDGAAVVDFGGTDSGSSVALQANGKIVVGGQSSLHAAVARLQPGGSPDTTFHGSGKLTIPAGIDGATGLALQADGRIVITGGDGTPPGNVAVARLQGDTPSSGGGPGGGGPGGGGGTVKVPRCAGKRATIVGTGRSERLKGTRRADVIVALGGNDKIAGGRGNDVICAGDGKDTVTGDSGNDRLYGQSGKDKLKGGTGNDAIDGGSSNDRLLGQSGKDRLKGGTGNDAIDGGSGKDNLAGGAGKDKLKGGTGSDSCDGGRGHDRATCERRSTI